MEFTYETQGPNTYLVWKVASGEHLDSAVLGILTNNRIGGLSIATFSQFDDVRTIKYKGVTKNYWQKSLHVLSNLIY